MHKEFRLPNLFTAHPVGMLQVRADFVLHHPRNGGAVVSTLKSACGKPEKLGGSIRMRHIRG